MSDLPLGWKTVPLEDVCDVNPREPGPVDHSTAVSFIPMPAVSDTDGVILRHESKPYGDIAKGYTRFREQDVIFAKITPCMENGKAAVATELHSGFACGSTEFHVLRSSTAILPRYLWRFLRQESFRKEAEHHMTGAVGQRRVPAQYIKDAQIPLPPVPEQSRIVAKLDNLFQRSKSAREELARIPRLIERYKEATLAAAFRGELTAKWRLNRALSPTIEVRLKHEEPYEQVFRAPIAWTENTIATICEIVGGSQPAKATFRYEPQDGFIRLIQIRDYKSSDRATYIPKDLPRRFCTSEDVMIGRYGPPLFQILRGLEGAYNVALMKAVPRPGCLNEFLYYRLQDPALRRYVEMGSDRTAGQDGVNKAHLLKYPIFLPSEDEQRVIVCKIEERFAAIKKLASESSRAMGLVGRLEQATLAKAFAGKLLLK